jgi:hypothetical protein
MRAAIVASGIILGLVSASLAMPLAPPPDLPTSDHAVRAAEPEWAARRAALHSKFLALAAIT